MRDGSLVVTAVDRAVMVASMEVAYFYKQRLAIYGLLICAYFLG